MPGGPYRKFAVFRGAGPSGRWFRSGSRQKEIEMNSKTEGTLAIVAALLVLFSAMWDARISAVVSVIALLTFGVFKFLNKDA
jgi:hypothetical protein